MQYFEIVPNLSEGRRRRVIARCSNTLRRDSSVRVLDVHSDPSHNRSVITAVAPRPSIATAASRLCRLAIQEIDLNAQSGVHPRTGALDVLPIVPLQDSSIDDAVELARNVGALLSREHGLPVFLCGRGVDTPFNLRLADLRRGGLAGLQDRLRRGEVEPSFGPRELHRSAGAVAICPRHFLIAYNVYLDNAGLAVARAVARTVRASSGGLPHVEAYGLLIEHREKVQVSMNLTCFSRTSLLHAFEAVASEAVARGAEVASSEVVGLLPERAWGSESWVERLKLPERPGLLEERMRQVGVL